MTRPLVLGAVAYDPKVVTIWDGFRAWFREHGLAVDYLLYPHYERLADDLVAGRLDLAWNSPLAWLRASRLAAAAGRSLRPLVMRDTDRDLTSVVVVREDAGIRALPDLAGKLVATGAMDSPQGNLIPLDYLATEGVPVRVRRFDTGVGLHGDHIGGERDAARALAAGEVDAAVMLDANHLLFGKEGVLPPGGTRLVGQTGRYDHCNLTATGDAPAGPVERFRALLLGMSYADPRLRRLLDLEGLTRWEPGRTVGYQPLAAAVDRCRFYGPAGELRMPEYQP